MMQTKKFVVPATAEEADNRHQSLVGEQRTLEAERLALSQGSIRYTTIGRRLDEINRELKQLRAWIAKREWDQVRAASVFAEPADIEEATNRRAELSIQYHECANLLRVKNGLNYRDLEGTKEKYRLIQEEMTFLKAWLRIRGHEINARKPTRGGMLRMVLVCLHGILVGDDGEKAALAEALGHWLEDSDDGTDDMEQFFGSATRTEE